MAFAITKTWTSEILTSADLNGAFSEIETELNAFPTDGALAALSVGTSQLQANAVTLAKMAASSVGTSQLVDASVTEAKLGTGAVTENKYGAASVTAAKISTILGSFTLNDSDTNAIAHTSVYLTTSDGLLIIITPDSDNAGIVTGYTDGSNPPTTTRLKFYDNTTIGPMTGTLPLRSGDYVKITISGSGTLTMYWIPLGGGELQKQ